MAGKQVWVSPNKENGWKVKTVGTKRAAIIQRLKERAEEIGMTVARNKRAELIIQKKDGTIQIKNSFGKDKFPPRG